MNISTKLLLLTAAMGVSLSSQAITFDGKYDGKAPYTNSFSFAYQKTEIIQVPDPADTNDCDKKGVPGKGDKPCLPEIDQEVITAAPGGILAFGTDGAGNQYVFFSHPLGFKDNSWGDNGVGWDGDPQSFGAAAGSEHFGFWIDGEGGLQGADNDFNSQLLVRVEYDDPITPAGASSAVSGADGNPSEGGHGVEVKGGEPLPAGTVINAMSTIQYNADQLNGGGIGSGTNNDLPDPSPAVVPGCAADDSSGTSLTDSGVNNTGCYAVADPATYGNWVFNAGVELQFTPGYFDVNFADLQLDDENGMANGKSSYAFDYFDFRAQLDGESFAIAHASPAKILGVVELVVDDTTNVPEPETLALFMLGLMLMRRQLRGGVPA